MRTTMRPYATHTITSDLIQALNCQITEEGLVDYQPQQIDNNAKNVLGSVLASNLSLKDLTIAPINETTASIWRDVLTNVALLSNLEALHLGNLPLDTPELLTVLQSNPGLRSLHLTLSPETAQTLSTTNSLSALFAQIRLLKNLTFIDLSHHNLCGYGQQIAVLIQQLPIRTIYLRDCQLTDDDVNKIAEAINTKKSDPTSKLHLSLSMNILSLEAVKQIVQALPHNTVANIDYVLHKTEIDDPGLQALIQQATDIGHDTITMKPVHAAHKKGL